MPDKPIIIRNKGLERELRNFADKREQIESELGWEEGQTEPKRERQPDDIQDRISEKDDDELGGKNS